MSLLMDALKRAEQANQQGQVKPPSVDTPALSLETVVGPAEPSALEQTPPPTMAPSALPQLPRLEDLDKEFIAHAQQKEIPRGQAASTDRAAPQAMPAGRPAAVQQLGSKAQVPAGEAAEREAVRNAFAMKRAGKSNRTPGLIVGAISSLTIAAAGVYFWLQLRPIQGPTALMAVRPAERAIATGATGAQAIPPSGVPIPSPADGMPRLKEAELIAHTRPRELPHSRVAILPTVADPIRITTSRIAVNPASDEGYRAFQSGNLTGAKTAYERLLQAEPRNIEALHGLAAIALSEGRLDEAEAGYLRILAADPRDAAANAGLVGLRSQDDQVASESRIKSLLAAQPNTSVLHFALGNLYAHQNRWSEAQQAYFNATRADPDNPDYLFNLAVSLDQLHQPKLAAHYYRQASAAAESQPARFDRALVANRLRDLQP
ncbi:MAG TPA: tetratricopeptide repeat protein [Rhodocyclaceae bacterium]|nr:tetratricopeptide repeat protein [Rhodocyclaceae bacterium]